MAQIKKTDNSNFDIKKRLRNDFLPNKKNICVLDCFYGNGFLWKEIIKINKNKNINVIGIDKKDNKHAKIIGDNIKYLLGMENLNIFDIIDLDSYGIPFKQCEILYNKKYTGIVFFTAIRSLYGALPKNMLNKIGFSNEMINECPTLFYNNDRFFQYLSLTQVKKIKYYQPEQKKIYGTFRFCFK